MKALLVHQVHGEERYTLVPLPNDQAKPLGESLRRAQAAGFGLSVIRESQKFAPVTDVLVPLVYLRMGLV
jgi:hypothetical protein